MAKTSSYISNDVVRKLTTVKLGELSNELQRFEKYAQELKGDKGVVEITVFVVSGILIRMNYATNDEPIMLIDKNGKPAKQIGLGVAVKALNKGKLFA
jgi:peroxiredoxin